MLFTAFRGVCLVQELLLLFTTPPSSHLLPRRAICGNQQMGSERVTNANATNATVAAALAAACGKATLLRFS